MLMPAGDSMLLEVALGELDKWDLASWLGFAGDSEEGELIETAGTPPPAVAGLPDDLEEGELIKAAGNHLPIPHPPSRRGTKFRIDRPTRAVT